MTDQTQLIKDLHDALIHLYDLPYLLNNPLARASVGSGHAESSGRILRRLLLDAIQELKPPAQSPHESVAASRYEFLHLRYVQGQSIEEMARRFNLSERQLYRRQHEALEAVATILARHLPLDGMYGAKPAPDSAPERPGADLEPLPRDTDVDRIGMAHASPPVNLVEVLNGIEETLAPWCQSLSREIRVRTEHAALPVTVDRVALRQALLALLTSAIGAVPSGTIAIEVGTVGDQARILVEVPATGQGGFPAIDDSNLVVCRRLIELQGGRVLADPDHRSGIIITLPAFQRRSVLVVDDNSDSRHLFTRYLEGRGYHVLTAVSGEQALQVTLRERPDAILLDVMLPSSDGYEVLQALASEPTTGRIPIVVCTVLKQRELALALGATEFLAKPVSQGELLDALDRCWGHPDSAR